VTDSSTNDSSAIYITVAGVTNDIIGYHFLGEITNVGRAAIYNVQATVHLDDSSTEVGNTTQYTKPENIGVGQTASFDPTFDKYAKAINAKAQPFPSEPVIMALLFSQLKMIEWLQGQISKPKNKFSESFGSIIEGNFTQS
jgi:hypothetical protein